MILSLGRMAFILIIGLTVVYACLFFYWRSGARMKLEEDWVMAGRPGEREEWVGDRLAPRLEGAFESARVLLAPREVIGPTLLSAASWGLECLAFLLIARSLAPAGVELPRAWRGARRSDACC